jgi:phosphate transport system substrate-binding protein
MINSIKKLALTVGAGALLAQSAMAGTLQVKGSDTMVHLSSAWAEAFMKENPSIEVAVTGGGSGTGISALINGTADIANASRTMKSSEIAAAKGKGFTPVEHIVGLDGICVIVNPSNPVKNLTMAQVKKIYTGEVSNWKAFGGDNQKITVFTRDSSSGTFQFFQEHVLDKMDYSVRARRLASNSALVQAVQDDINGIGYVGMGYVKEAAGKVKVLPIAKDDKSAPINPSEESVRSGSYPISRGLQMYSKGEPSGDAKAFFDFIMGSTGQKIVSDMGFVSKQ